MLHPPYPQIKQHSSPLVPHLREVRPPLLQVEALQPRQRRQAGQVAGDGVVGVGVDRHAQLAQAGQLGHSLEQGLGANPEVGSRPRVLVRREAGEAGLAGSQEGVLRGALRRCVGS